MLTCLGVVSFLNTRPLVHALESGDILHSFDLLYDVPSRCAERLHQGETDIALIPSIEIPRARESYNMVPGIGIASFGPVQSVVLVLKKDPAEVRTLALDANSRASSVLCQIVFEKVYGHRPEVFESPPDLKQMLDRSDAALLIGDSALGLDPRKYRLLDLGEAWSELTGLPFVYACWTGRPGSAGPDEVKWLTEAKALGVGMISEIARVWAASNLYTSEFYEAYLTRRISYDVGEREREGLRLFYEYAFELGLINRIPQVGLFAEA